MSALEVLSFAATISIGAWAIWRFCGRFIGARWVGVLGAALFAAISLLRARAMAVNRMAVDAVQAPIGASTSNGYVSSNACRSCHPAEHQTWHTSFHRSMTEVATPRAVRAPLGDVALTWQGQPYRLFRRGDEFWARLPDPGLAAERARQGQRWDDVADVERRVVMTTGSHHYQAYWVTGARGNELWQFPFVYHFEGQRFIPRHDAFLQPPDDPAFWARWNSNCIQCHSVAGEPRHDKASDRFDSQAAELGVGCEACHGPGAEHVARHQNPVTRYRARRGTAPDPSIVNPARLDPERASEACGQCHSYFVPSDPEEWWDNGFTASYHPGDGLESSRLVLDYARDSASADSVLDASLDSVFYADGTVRVGGREWNGLVRSACFERGSGTRRLSCLSCHQMHGSAPNDQLGEHGESNFSCQACHENHVARPMAHSRHGEGSSGNLCVNCHMPYTTYALFKGIRSHRITIPTVEPDTGHAMNACNLCHQDQSLAWTSHWLEQWHGNKNDLSGKHAEPEMALEAPLGGSRARTAAEGRERWSAAAVALLSGDAATRVILAYQLGWAEAREVSGRHWQAQLLVEALDDPYAAVRFVAHRSLLTLPGFQGYEYDFIADRSIRLEQQGEARRRAMQNANAPPDERRLGAPALPSDAAGRLERAFVERFSAMRDERPIRISE